MKIIDSSVNSKQVDSGTLAGQIVLSLVFLLSGILLLVGAIKVRFVHVVPSLFFFCFSANRH